MPCAICSIHGHVADRNQPEPQARPPNEARRPPHLATATEVKPAAEYAPLTRPGHNAETVLEVEGLQTYLFTRLGVVKAVDDVSFAIRRAETLAIVGESGCGKTMTALSLLRLGPKPPRPVGFDSGQGAGQDPGHLHANEKRHNPR